MKKSNLEKFCEGLGLTFILLAGGIAFADIGVTPGSGKTVATQTVNGREIQAINVTDGANQSTWSITGGAGLVTSTGIPVTLSPTGVAQLVVSSYTVITSTYFLNVNDVMNSSGTYGVSPFNQFGEAIGFVNPVTNALQAPRVDVASNVYITFGGQGQPTTSTSTVITSTYSINTIANFSGQAQPTTSTSTVVTSTSPLNITHGNIGQPVTSTFTIVTTTTPLQVVQSTPMIIASLVSSTTLPSTLANATTGSMLMTGQRALITADFTWETQLTTSNANAAAISQESILISSAPAGTRTRLCGCTAMNTSATVDLFQVWSGTSALAATFGIIPAPASNAGGYKNDCGHPFFVSNVASEITYKAVSAVSTIYLSCQYIQF